MASSSVLRTSIVNNHLFNLLYNTYDWSVIPKGKKHRLNNQKAKIQKQRIWSGSPLSSLDSCGTIVHVCVFF